MKIDLTHGRIRWTVLAVVATLCGALMQSNLAAADDGPPRQPPPPGGDFFSGPPPGGGQDSRDPNHMAWRYLQQAQGMAGGETGKYWIGVECREAPPELMSQLGLKEGEGLVVVHVADDSPAVKVGLKQHDLILSSGDVKLKRPQELIKAVNAAEGKEISLKIMRGGKEQTVAVTPAERSQDNWRVFARPGTGMMFPGGGQPPKIPDNVTISIVRQGSKPAKITVSRGDEKWEVTSDSLDKLPEELRPIVQGMDGGNPMTIRFPGAAGMSPLHLDMPSPGGPGINAIQELLGQQGPGAGPGPGPNGPPPRNDGPGGPPQNAGPGGPPDLMQRLDEIERNLQRLQDALHDLRENGQRDGGPRAGGPRDGGPRDGGPRDGGPQGRGRGNNPPPDGDRRGPPDDGDRRGPPPRDP